MAAKVNKSLEVPYEDEETSLLSSSKRKRKKHWYTCKWIIKSRGTVLILAWLALIQSFDPVVAISMVGLGHERLDEVFLIYTCCSFLFYLFFPVIGLYADIKFGRHRIALAVVIVSLLCTVLVAVGAGLAETKTGVAALVIFSIGFIIGNLAQTGFMIVMAGYGFDQLTGASSEELAAYSHWYYWCHIFGWVITVPLTCALNVKYGVLVIYALHILCLSVVFVSVCLSKRLGVVEMQLPVNPLTQMVKVFQYARRNKHPKNRSALTYWEEKLPSRLDLGKGRYGGPFTEDEVEDVKTFLKMLPLLVCMVFFLIIMDQFNTYYFMIHKDEQYFFSDCLLSSVYFVNSTVILVTMFIYQIFKPLFDKCLPTMLRRIGFGIFLVIMTEAIWLSIDVAGHYQSDNLNSTCVFKSLNNETSSASVQWNIDHKWILLPKVVMGVSFGIAIPTTLEFVFAQAPHSMKGLVVGVWFMATGSIKMIAFNMHYPFMLLDGVWPNCSFYYYLTKTGIVGVSFMCFIALAVWYKPRQRELLYESHNTVEDFYEKEFERRYVYEGEKRRKKLSGVVERDVSNLDINEYLSSLYNHDK